MAEDFWVWVFPEDRVVAEADLGLIAEAVRLRRQGGAAGEVIAVCFTGANAPLPDGLQGCGADRVIRCVDARLSAFHGELCTEAFRRLVEQKGAPALLLMRHGRDQAEVAGRLGGLFQSAVASRAVDFALSLENGTAVVTRPRSNGHLYESIRLGLHPFPIVTVLPTVLSVPETIGRSELPLETVSLDLSGFSTAVERVSLAAADPETLDIEEADIIVAAGRGAGKDLSSLGTLARILGGAVGGTRPVVDWGGLPFPRQIGQTGKTVTPKLIINCGISGANEYTAGMEKAQRVVAVNTDASARIFRFADLGLIGDVHEILPLLIDRLGGGGKRE